MPTPSYHGLKPPRLRAMLTALGLPSGGSVSEMREWHRAYVAQHNAMVDSGDAFRPADVLSTVLAAQRLRESEQAQAAKARALVAGAMAAAESVGAQAAPSKLQKAFLELVKTTRRRDKKRMRSLNRQRRTSKGATATKNTQPKASPVKMHDQSDPWLAIFSERVQRIFYFNQDTGVGQWETPAGIEPMEPIRMPPPVSFTPSAAQRASHMPIAGTLTQTLPYTGGERKGPLDSAFAAAGGGSAARGGRSSNHEEEEIVLLESQDDVLGDAEHLSAELQTIPAGGGVGAAGGPHNDSVADTLILTRGVDASMTATQVQAPISVYTPRRSVFEETEEESQLLGALHSPPPNTLPRLPKRNTRSKNIRTGASASQGAAASGSPLPVVPALARTSEVVSSDSGNASGSQRQEDVDATLLRTQVSSQTDAAVHGGGRGRGRGSKRQERSGGASDGGGGGSTAEAGGRDLYASESAVAVDVGGWSCPACTLEHTGDDALLEGCKLCGTLNPAASALVRHTRRRRR